MIFVFAQVPERAGEKNFTGRKESPKLKINGLKV